MKKILFLLLFLFAMLMPITSMAFENKEEDKKGEFIQYTGNELPFYLNEEASGKGVKVAVIDSGIAKHGDLKVAGGYNFIYPGKTYEDDNNHGTMVAGILSGQKEGVAPDVELYALKVFDSEARGYSDDIENALEWSIENDIDIINMSIIMDDASPSLNRAIKKATEHGIIVVACAGNNSGEVTNPANVDGVISVGALNLDWQTKASFSSYIGKVDYWAKGNDVTSTNRYGSYESGWWGTSFASPYVAGIFALYKEAFPEVTAEELKEIVFANSIKSKGNTEYQIPQKPEYAKRGFIQFKSENGQFKVKHVIRYLAISNTEKRHEIEAEKVTVGIN